MLHRLEDYGILSPIRLPSVEIMLVLLVLEEVHVYEIRRDNAEVLCLAVVFLPAVCLFCVILLFIFGIIWNYYW